MQKYLPDPFLFAIILTFVVFLMGWGLTDSGPADMVKHWGTGFWSLLAFSMQMILILVTGFVLANSPIFKKLLSLIAGIAKSPGQGIMLVGFVSAIASFINWGFGLVIGALLAKEVARKIENVHYPLLIATAYMGFLVWHAGFAGSVPLTIAGDKHFLVDQIGVIPTTETIFAPFNLIIAGALLIIIPIVARFMMPSKEDTFTIDRNLLNESETAAAAETVKTPAEKLENSWIISVLTALLGFVYIFFYFSDKGFAGLNLNIVIFIFLFLGILLHFRPINFLDSLKEAIKGSAGIAIQFPFYAGIMGMMVASGLAGVISDWFVSFSNEVTLPLFTFLSAGIVNFFVPSGGGQWAVQGPVMMPAALELGADTAKVAMSVAWGDAWTNMIQPFWALPALGIAGLKAKDIMGYTTMALLISGVVIALGLVIF